MLTIAYDGTDYCGWQIQKNGVSIEEVLTGAVRKVTGEEMALCGASRTDSGVHALGNVVTFDTESSIPAEIFARAVNTNLPHDIRVRKSCEVPGNFNPRYDGLKTYEYYVLNTPDEIPTERRTHWYVTYELDLDQMREAAQLFVGEHDFAGFCSAGYSGKSTVRTIYRSDVVREGDLITYTVTGNGFLYNMVRIITGTLISVGCGKIAPEEIPSIIAAKDRQLAGDTALAKGLTLEEICYATRIENAADGRLIR